MPRTARIAIKGAARLVVVAAQDDVHLELVGLVHEPIRIVDAPGPEAREVFLSGSGLPMPSKGSVVPP